MVRDNYSRLNIQFLYTSIFTEWKKVVGFNLIDWRSDSAHYLLNYEPHFSLYLTNGGAYKTGYFLTSSSLYFFGQFVTLVFCHIFYRSLKQKSLYHQNLLWDCSKQVQVAWNQINGFVPKKWDIDKWSSTLFGWKEIWMIRLHSLSRIFLPCYAWLQILQNDIFF